MSNTTIGIDEYKRLFATQHGIDPDAGFETVEVVDLEQDRKPTGIGVKVVLDSISAGPEPRRLTTLECRFPRIVLAEVNTHRAASRNSASSRAIPSQKMLQRVTDDPFVPMRFGINRAGMQSTEFFPLDSPEHRACLKVCLRHRDQAVTAVEEMTALGMHKQHANRYLESWLWHTAIVTGTSWENILNQRFRSDDPQPEFWLLASAINAALLMSEPTVLKAGEWHTPYIFEHERAGIDPEDLKLISVARCARVSYLTHDGQRDVSEDLALCRRLMGATPMHASPFEHVATPNPSTQQRGNFRGWKQLRHVIEDRRGIDSSV